MHALDHGYVLVMTGMPLFMKDWRLRLCTPGAMSHVFGMVITFCNLYSLVIAVNVKKVYLNRLYCRNEVNEGSLFGLPS
jgi:hypothetical protein